MTTISLEAGNRLRSLLSEESELAPAMLSGLSNHRSMTLIDLAQLGASSIILDDFDSSYAAEVEALPGEGEPLDSVGLRPEDFRAVSAEVRADLGQDFAEAVDRWGRIPSIGGHAFHGLIRTAYGYELPVELGQLDELARGLAYWDVAAMPPLVGRGRPTSSLVDAVAVACQLGSTAPAQTGNDLIFQQFQALYATAGVADSLPVWLPPGDINEAFTDYLDVTCDLWARHPDSFLALHLVTAAHAAWVLRDALTHSVMMPVVLASYAVLGAAILGSGSYVELPSDPLSWEDLVESAVASKDPHVIKPTYSLRQLTESGLLDDHRARALLTHTHSPL